MPVETNKMCETVGKLLPIYHWNGASSKVMEFAASPSYGGLLGYKTTGNPLTVRNFPGH